MNEENKNENIEKTDDSAYDDKETEEVPSSEVTSEASSADAPSVATEPSTDQAKIASTDVSEVPKKEVPTTIKEPSDIPSEETVPSTLQDNASEQSSSGPLAGIAIIIIVLIAGGIYFWSITVDKNGKVDQLPTIQSGGETDAIVNQLNTQGTSDEVTDIEADLNTTDLENLDSELNDLLNEF